MPSQYQQIKGERYERDLLDIAREAMSQNSRGELGQDVAERLWNQAMDGNRVTAIERRTLEFILAGGDGQFKMSAAGATYLRRKLDESPPGGGGAQPALEPPAGRGRGGGGYYRRVNSVNYDRALLESADRMVAGGGSITQRGALQLWADAHDGRGVTDCERRTLAYIAGAYPFEHNAAPLLRSLAGDADLPALDAEALDAAAPAGPPRRGSRGEQGGQRVAALALEAPPSGRRGGATEQGGGAPRGRSTGLAALEAPPGGAPRGRSRSRSPRPQGSGSQSRAGSLLALASRWLPPLFRRAGAGGGTEVARPGGSPAGRGEGGAASGGASAGGGLEGILAPEVAKLLRDDDAGGGPLPEVTDAAEPVLDDAVERKRAEAVREVARILSTRRADDILGGGSKEERMREFRRLALLLHPDKPWASNTEPAVLAYRLTLAAKKKIQ